MTGMAGMISQRPSDECRLLVSSMVRCMVHENSFTSGLYCVPEMRLYAGWVSDECFGGAKPVLQSERGDISLLLSGECFPDGETLSELRRKGHESERASADWLVHLYEEEGDDFFKRLNGLFSGLLVDRRRARAFLFNDRYGIGRLYWCETSDAIYFASEAKAILRVVPESRAFDEEGVAHFLTFGCTLESRTLFRGIERLTGGSLYTFEEGNCKSGRYFDLAEWETQEPLTTEAFQTAFQESFTTILPRYFESEAPIGMALTGGLDTRMIMACRPERADVVCYTYAGAEGETLDARLAAKVAQISGLDHTVIRLGPDFLPDFASHSDRTVYLTDGSFGIAGAHELYLSTRARDLARVRLTGVFGGEVLREISNFKPLGLSAAILSSSADPSMVRWSVPSSNPARPGSAAAFKQILWSISGTVAACRSQLSFRTPYLDNRIVPLAFQAPDEVRRSPSSALSLIRERNRRLATVATDRGLLGERSYLRGAIRSLLGEATFRLEYFCNEGLPSWLSPMDFVIDHLHEGQKILGRHKFLRYRRWFRRELANYVRDRLDAARQSPLWDRERLSRMAYEHIAGRKNHAGEINAILTLEAVERLLIHASSGALSSPSNNAPLIAEEKTA